MIQCNTPSLHKKSKNLHRPQQLSEVKPGIDVMYPTSYNMVNKQEYKMLQGETRPLVVESQLHFAQPLVSSQMNTVPPNVVDTTLQPLLLTKREKEEAGTHTVDSSKMP